MSAIIKSKFDASAFLYKNKVVKWYHGANNQDWDSVEFTGSTYICRGSWRNGGVAEVSKAMAIRCIYRNRKHINEMIRKQEKENEL